jgi:hypothetical protein
MSSLIERLTTLDAWEAAVDKYQPAELARRLVRDLTDRHIRFDLDGYARLAFDLYGQRRAGDAWAFRNRLEERLLEHGLGPVRWESDIRYCWHRQGRW